MKKEIPMQYIYEIEMRGLCGLPIFQTFKSIKIDGLVKSRHSGGNRSPENF